MSPHPSDDDDRTVTIRIQEEATKVGVPYVEYKWLPTILSDFCAFMKTTGQAPAPPNNAFPPRGGMGAAAKVAAA